MEEAAKFTLADARDAVRLLSQEFDVHEPEVVASTAQVSRACYPLAGVNGRVTLKLSTRDWHGLEEAALHEFTHALRFYRVRGRHGHDRLFFDALVRVITAWRGNPAKYDWSKEYRTLYDFAVEQGLTTATHHRQQARTMLQAAGATQAPGIGSVPAVPPAPVSLRIGQRVTWWSQKRNRRFEGAVVSAYAGCRARVRVDGYGQFYVPQHWLQPVAADRSQERLSA